MRGLMTLVPSVGLERFAVVMGVRTLSWRDKVRPVHGKGAAATSRKSIAAAS
jgi:hypothetical protein